MGVHCSILHTVFSIWKFLEEKFKFISKTHMALIALSTLSCHIRPQSFLQKTSLPSSTSVTLCITCSQFLPLVTLPLVKADSFFQVNLQCYLLFPNLCPTWCISPFLTAYDTLYLSSHLPHSIPQDKRWLWPLLSASHTWGRGHRLSHAFFPLFVSFLPHCRRNCHHPLSTGEKRGMRGWVTRSQG